MNRILFEENELQKPLNPSDPRIVHIRKILRLKSGDDFSGGVINGPTGRARLTENPDNTWTITFTAEGTAVPFEPLCLILGCPRPPVARRILKDMTSVGVREIRVCDTDLNEKSYLTSKLWRDGLWREAVIDGAMQAASSLIPTVTTFLSLEKALESIPDHVERICLDNGEGSIPFSLKEFHFGEAVLAVGPERGWSARETDVFKSLGFSLLHMGERILRTETACAIGAGLVIDRLRLLPL